MADAWTYLTGRSFEALMEQESLRSGAARDRVARVRPTDPPAMLRLAADAIRAALPEITDPPVIATLEATADMIAERARSAELRARIGGLERAITYLEHAIDKGAGGAQSPTRLSRPVEPESSPPEVQPPDDPLPAFAANVRAARDARGMTQDTVADGADMETSYYGRLERGQIEPGVRAIVRVARSLGVAAADLMVGVG
jgi:DNA-binding XRE family transcriptional regulator